MRCAGRIQGEKLASRMRSALGISTTLHMPTAPAARSPCTQALIVETRAQKSRAGGFPPPLVVIFSQRKLLAKQQPLAANQFATLGRPVSPARIKCL
jgi:hypothetical protein